MASFLSWNPFSTRFCNPFLAYTFGTRTPSPLYGLVMIGYSLFFGYIACCLVRIDPCTLFISRMLTNWYYQINILLSVLFVITCVVLAILHLHPWRDEPMASIALSMYNVFCLLITMSMLWEWTLARKEQKSVDAKKSLSACLHDFDKLNNDIL